MQDYPTEEQLTRIHDLALQLEEALRECKGARFEVKYGTTWRTCPTVPTVRELVSNAITIEVSHRVTA